MARRKDPTLEEIGQMTQEIRKERAKREMDLAERYYILSTRLHNAQCRLAINGVDWATIDEVDTRFQTWWDEVVLGEG